MLLNHSMRTSIKFTEYEIGFKKHRHYTYGFKFIKLIQHLLMISNNNNFLINLVGWGILLMSCLAILNIVRFVFPKYWAIKYIFFTSAIELLIRHIKPKYIYDTYVIEK